MSPTKDATPALLAKIHAALAGSMLTPIEVNGLLRNQGFIEV